MAEQNLSDEPTSRKPLVLIKPAEMRRRRGISRAQEYVMLQKGLLPRPVWQAGSRYYVEHELEEDTARLLAERDAPENGVNHSPDPTLCPPRSTRPPVPPRLEASPAR